MVALQAEAESAREVARCEGEAGLAAAEAAAAEARAELNATLTQLQVGSAR